MSRKDEYRRSLLAIFLASLVIFTVLAYVATTPRPSEEFFQIYILGSDHKLEHFYPNDNSSITPNAYSALVRGRHKLNGHRPVRHTQVQAWKRNYPSTERDHRCPVPCSNSPRLLTRSVAE